MNENLMEDIFFHRVMVDLSSTLGHWNILRAYMKVSKYGMERNFLHLRRRIYEFPRCPEQK